MKRRKPGETAAALKAALTGPVAPGATPAAPVTQDAGAPTKMVILFDDPVVSRRTILRLVRLMADYGSTRYADTLDRLLGEEASRRGWSDEG